MPGSVNDLEFDDFNAQDEDSSDYFLASSVDTVISAPFMSRAAAGGFGVKDVAAPVNFAKAATPKLPLSGSQGSLNSSFNSSYTNSLAKNFLNDNKMNVNSNKSNKVSSKPQQTVQVASSQTAIPIESGTPKQQLQGKHKSNLPKTNIITNSIKKLFKKKSSEQPTKVRWNAYF